MIRDFKIIEEKIHKFDNVDLIQKKTHSCPS